jgi:hypothetical protein
MVLARVNSRSSAYPPYITVGSAIQEQIISHATRSSINLPGLGVRLNRNNAAMSRGHPSICSAHTGGYQSDPSSLPLGRSDDRISNTNEPVENDGRYAALDARPRTRAPTFPPAPNSGVD